MLSLFCLRFCWVVLVRASHWLDVTSSRASNVFDVSGLALPEFAHFLCLLGPLTIVTFLVPFGTGLLELGYSMFIFYIYYK